MQSEELYQIFHRKPFRPFRIQLNDGRSFDIRFQHMGLIGKTFFDFGILDPADTNREWPIADRTESVDPADIVRVEYLETPHAPAAS
jgi:hypothetical protein